MGNSRHYSLLAVAGAAAAVGEGSTRKEFSGEGGATRMNPWMTLTPGKDSAFGFVA